MSLNDGWMSQGMFIAPHELHLDNEIEDMTRDGFFEETGNKVFSEYGTSVEKQNLDTEQSTFTVNARSITSSLSLPFVIFILMCLSFMFGWCICQHSKKLKL